jgi:hypothetical protein
MVMGGVTVIQHLHENRVERGAREALLKKSLSPLVLQLEEADSINDIEQALQAFHRAYVKRGYPDHQVVLMDSKKRVLVSTLFGSPPDPGKTFRVSVPVDSPALTGKRGTITVWEDSTDYNAEVSRQWRSWWLHMIVTLLSILLFLQVAIHYLVSRPLERLLDGVRKMEMGYWEEMPIPRGAWEIRWLGWRFRGMGIELKNTVQQLLAAERRALKYIFPVSRHTSAELPKQRSDTEPAPVESEITPRYQHLVAMCQLLESTDKRDSNTLTLAQAVWDQYVVEAERLGDRELKARLEDASLRILHPEPFRLLKKQLEALRNTLREWLEQIEADIRKVLESETVPYINVRHRIKHAAGVFRKMTTKGLTLEQIHDLFAFRVLVPTEPDCYWALGVIHQAFEPMVGRFKDYIANPKENGYQSLHTRVRTREGPVFEVQIRSVAMHRHAEKGPAAHWLYKDRDFVSTPSRSGLCVRLRSLWKKIRKG